MVLVKKERKSANVQYTRVSKRSRVSHCFYWVKLELCHTDEGYFISLFYKRRKKDTLIKGRIKHVIDSGEIMKFSAKEAEAIMLVAIIEESLQAHSHLNIGNDYLNAIKIIAKNFNMI